MFNNDIVVHTTWRVQQMNVFHFFDHQCLIVRACDIFRIKCSFYYSHTLQRINMELESNV